MCLLIVFDEPQQQTAKRFFLACSALPLVEQRFNTLRNPFQFRIILDDARQRTRKQFGILPAIQPTAASSLSSRSRGRIPRA